MVGQDHPGVDAERALHQGQPCGLSQRLDLAQQKVAAARGEGDGHEEGGAGAPGAAASGHGRSFAGSG